MKPARLVGFFCRLGYRGISPIEKLLVTTSGTAQAAGGRPRPDPRIHQKLAAGHTGGGDGV